MIDLPRGYYGAILADPPWRFETWDKRETLMTRGTGAVHYNTMTLADIAALPVSEIAADDCVLFLWATWPNLMDAMHTITAWGFVYKSAAFVWTKANATQIEMFDDEMMGAIGMGYWTRANTEPCLLATRGNPKRLDAGVHQAVIAPRRQHSRKPDCVHERIERLVAGPYIELFARRQKQGWCVWGNEVQHGRTDDVIQS